MSQVFHLFGNHSPFALSVNIQLAFFLFQTKINQAVYTLSNLGTIGKRATDPSFSDIWLAYRLRCLFDGLSNFRFSANKKHGFVGAAKFRDKRLGLLKLK